MSCPDWAVGPPAHPPTLSLLIHLKFLLRKEDAERVTYAAKHMLRIHDNIKYLKTLRMYTKFFLLFLVRHKQDKLNDRFSVHAVVGIKSFPNQHAPPRFFVCLFRNILSHLRSLKHSFPSDQLVLSPTSYTVDQANRQRNLYFFLPNFESLSTSPQASGFQPMCLKNFYSMQYLTL